VLIGAVIGALSPRRSKWCRCRSWWRCCTAFVGLAAVLVGFASYLDPNAHYEGAEKTIHEVESTFGVFMRRGHLTDRSSLRQAAGNHRRQAAHAAGAPWA